MTTICDFSYPIYDENGGKMAKIDTLLMTKTADIYPYSPYKGVPPPFREQTKE